MKRLCRRIASVPFFFVVSVVVVSVSTEMAPAGGLGEAVQLARQYLECTDSHEKVKLSRELAEYGRDWKDVIKALRLRPDQAVRPGYITLNDKPHFERRVSPSLATVLESFERRGNWGLVYPAKITLDIASTQHPLETLP